MTHQTATEIVPDLTHPVVQVVLCHAKRGTKDRYVIDADCDARLERKLLEHSDDPTLAGGILGLFQLAKNLYGEEGSKNAAETIVLTIGRVSPQLNGLRKMADGERNQREKGKSDALRLLGGAASAPLVSAPPLAIKEPAFKASAFIPKIRRP